jgi:hypothetical protein
MSAPGVSLRGAINAMCRECIHDPIGGFGNWREQVTACTSYKCPLFPVRPLTTGRYAPEKAVFSASEARSAPEQYHGKGSAYEPCS